MILVRHGQSHFNVHFAKTRVDPGIVDPQLTEEGERQAREAGERLAACGIRRIVASPYWRTLHTAEIIAEILDLPVTIEPQVRERYSFVCDVGSHRSELMRRWPRFAFCRASFSSARNLAMRSMRRTGTGCESGKRMVPLLTT